MPARPPEPQDRSITQWVDFTDFTPGCFNGSWVAGATPVITAPQAAADPSDTINVMALPNGGLAPMVRIEHTYVFPRSTTTPTTFYQVGMICNPTTDGDELVCMFEGNARGRLFYVMSYLPATTTPQSVYSQTNSLSTGYFGCPYPQMTRMQTVATATSKPGQPVVVFPYADSTDSHGNSGHLFVYPALTAPTAYGLQDLIKSATPGPWSSVTGQVIVHQGRVITLSGIDYPWPRGGINTNEQICFTTPSNSDTFKFQQEIMVPEFPYGYGGAGSISASELFLIKKRGGGVVITGDINTPYVTFLPGVQPTGNFYGNAGASPAGLFYCSDGQGAWFWNGGNASQKISAQLDDDFFVIRHLTPEQNNLRYYAQPWGEWVLFSNNWLYNLNIKSWWKFGTAFTTVSPALNTLFYYTPGSSTDVMYAGPQLVNTANRTVFACMLTKSKAAEKWKWKSLPIKLSENKYINIRECVIYASVDTVTTTGTIQVQFWLTGSVVFTHQITTIPDYPKMFRFPVGVTVADNLVVSMIATNSGGISAPYVHQISFGINTRQHLKTL